MSEPAVTAWIGESSCSPRLSISPLNGAQLPTAELMGVLIVGACCMISLPEKGCVANRQGCQGTVGQERCVLQTASIAFQLRAHFSFHVLIKTSMTMTT